MAANHSASSDMPLCADATQKDNRQASQPHVNTLPSEIVSKIFILCDRLWSAGVGKFPCQKTIPVVCRHWRRIALDTPAFWARVTISDSTSYDRAALHLLRSGKKVPLDIEFDQVQAYWSDWEEGSLHEFARQAKRRSKFLVKQGGAPSRWQRLLIQTDIFFVHLVALDFLRSTRLPALEYLEIRWYGPSDLDDEDYDKLTEVSHPSETPSLLFHDNLPPLHTVKLAGVPNPRLFGHKAHPQLVGLTHLEIDFLEYHPDLEDVHKMLAANPELVVLVLTTENITEEYPHEYSEVPSKPLSTIQFPKLRALSFSGVISSEWDLGVLATINAPNLNVLRIEAAGSPYNGEHFQPMLDLVALGRDKENPQPYFPALTNLCYYVFGGPTEELQRLLTAYPGINSLSVIGDHAITVLLHEPWLAPRLTRLRVISLAALDGLKEVVIARNRAGIPLKRVELSMRKLRETPDHKQPQDIRALEAWADVVIVDETDGEFARADPASW